MTTHNDPTTTAARDLDRRASLLPPIVPRKTRPKAPLHLVGTVGPAQPSTQRITVMLLSRDTTHRIGDSLSGKIVLVVDSDGAWGR